MQRVLPGIGMTLVLALLAQQLARFSFLAVMGQLMIAILLGMALRAVWKVPRAAQQGIAFSSKKLLRAGIILLGMRLDLAEIIQAGPVVLALAAGCILFAIAVVYGISRLFKADPQLSMLIACGTGICGAAAVAAIAPQIKANDQQTAIGVATVAVLGTIFTVVYVLAYPYLGFSPDQYGVYAGATLHEIAHVLAAAAPAGSGAVDTAIIVKLMRVILLVPTAILIGVWFGRREQKIRSADEVQIGWWKRLPIPWFIFGFLAMSGVHSLGIISAEWAAHLVSLAYRLMGMAMAGMGLGVDIAAFRKHGGKPFAAGLIGSILLSVMGYVLVGMFWA
ncbi:MAG: YeiH family protein [Clostridia bacterium]